MSQIERIASQVIRVRIDHPDAVYRSRILKLRIRDIVQGDLLYIDADTIILKNLSEIWNCESDIAAAPDIGSDGCPYSSSQIQDEKAARLGWANSNRTYLNAGVFYLRDSVVSHDFLNVVMRNWMEYINIFGKFNDQPAFNSALERIVRSSPPVGKNSNFQLLPQIWNAQITMNQMLGRKAKIVHIFSGNFETRDDTVLHVAAKRLRRDGVVDVDCIMRAISAGHVWTKLDEPKKYFAAGRYVKACAVAAKNHVARLTST